MLLNQSLVNRKLKTETLNLSIIASHESYEFDHLPIDLLHLSTNKEALMLSYIASVLLVVTSDSMRVFAAR